jgi:preprotein translocase subunit SecG
MALVIIVFTLILIFLLSHKYADSSHSMHANSQSQSSCKGASSLGAMHFEKASVKIFFLILHYCISAIVLTYEDLLSFG